VSKQSDTSKEIDFHIELSDIPSDVEESEYICTMVAVMTITSGKKTVYYDMAFHFTSSNKMETLLLYKDTIKNPSKLSIEIVDISFDSKRSCLLRSSQPPS